MKSGKRESAEGTELPNQECIRTLGEKENFKYLGILETDTIRQTEMKETIRKRYLRRTRKHLETKLCCRNLFKGINIWVVPLVIYSGLFLKWTREELRQLDKRTRKFMSMPKAFYPRDHHHHHIAYLAEICPTLSLHPSLSSIVPGRSSRLHPVSTQICCI